MLAHEVPLPFTINAGQVDCTLPLDKPHHLRNRVLRYFGIEIIMCTWSTIRCPSSIRLSSCSANVTTNHTAEWLAQQVVNAIPEDTAPRFLIRDHDRAYGLDFSARVRASASAKSAPPSERRR